LWRRCNELGQISLGSDQGGYRFGGSLSLAGVLVHRPVGAVQQSAKHLGGGHRPGLLS
jgi:hypothetical protein